MYHNYGHTHGGNGIHRVVDNIRNKTLEVNLHSPNCCSTLHDFRMPCQHVLLVLYKQKQLEAHNLKNTIEKYWEKRFHALEYYKAYSQAQVFIPHVEKGKYTGPDEDKLDPPIIKKTRGRPKNKKRRTKQTVKRKRRYLQSKFEMTEPGMERLLHRTPPELPPELPSPPAEPTVITGADVHVSTWVVKDFGDQIHFGEVEFTDVEKDTCKQLWHVKYQDGDEEDLLEYEIVRARKFFLEIFADDDHDNDDTQTDTQTCPNVLTCDEVRVSMWVAKKFGDTLYFGEVQYTDSEEGSKEQL